MCVRFPGVEQAGARGGMGMVTDLEQAVWATADPIRATRFGHILQNARRSPRDQSLPGPDDHVQGWELSFDPAIQRTLAAVTAIGIANRTPPDLESEWPRWNLTAKKALARVAAKCWAGIEANRRMVFLDEDNFQPVWGQNNVYDLRSDSWGRHLDFEGLNEPELKAALSAVYRAARATPAYEDVLRADLQLDRSLTKLDIWARLAQKGHQELESSSTGLTIADARERAVEIVDALYVGTPVEDIAAAFRRYNRLVQHIIWSILGLAEAVPEPFVLTETVGTMRCSRQADGSPLIRLTSAEASNMLLRVTYPVWLDTGTPLDGLHVVVGYTMRLDPNAASDLILLPIRWSARAWPDDLGASV